MDFSFSERQRHWRDRVVAFMAKHIYPAVDTYHKQMEAFGANRWQVIPILEELKRLREHVERYLTASSSEHRQLDVARNVVEAIWDEHEATVDGDTTAARLALSVALKLEPDNMYLRFLDRKQRASVETGDR